MFGSAVLEVAIGVIFSFMLLSLITSALNEGIASVLSLRAWTLQQGMRKLLNDPEGTHIVQMVYDHPMVSGLAHPSLAQRTVARVTRRNVAALPPYIPAHTFAMVLLEVMVSAVIPDVPGGRPTGLTEVGNAIGMLPERYDNVKRTLLTLIEEADGDVKVARANIEQWFNDGMDRVSGWYKRTAQAITLIVSAVLCLSLNADTIMMTDMLYHNSIMRAAIVAAASDSVRTAGSATDAYATLTTVMEAMDRSHTMQLPLGWVPPDPGVTANAALDARLVPASLNGWLAKMVGFALTMIAVSFGAPFWFGILSGMVKVRLDGEPPSRMLSDR